MLNFNFLEKGLELVYPPNFAYDFSSLLKHFQLPKIISGLRERL